MRFPTLHPLVCCTLAAILALSPASPAFADKRAIEDGIPDDYTRNGDPYNLPVDCWAFDEGSILHHAYGMGSVQAAMRVMDARGYIRRAPADTVSQICSSGTVVALLVYEHPQGYVDQDRMGVPMIVVRTQLDPQTNDAVTSVSGSVFVVDGAAGSIYPADDGTLFPNDPSFEIGVALGTSGMWDDVYNEIRNRNSYTNRWLRCTAPATLGCLTTAVLGANVPGLAAKLVGVFTPLGAFLVVSSCVIATGVACHGSIAMGE